MKTRLFIAIIFIIVFAGIIIYLLIPSPITVSNRITFSTSTNGAYRTLVEQENWDKFAPQTFFIRKRLVKTVEIDVKNKKHKIPVSILFIPLSNDSVQLVWKTEFAPVSNPVTKIKQYSQSMEVKNEMDKVLKQFQEFVAHNENIYGVHIKETSTKDTFLVATRFTANSLPSNEMVYSYINKLRTYTSSVGANVTGSPMLNITTFDSLTYRCMVAIPINKKVEGNGPLFFVRMVPGRFLTTEVTGGPHTISNAHRAMDQYFKDFNRLTMAIPFEYLITDRLKETDTSKWVTKVYGPVN